MHMIAYQLGILILGLTIGFISLQNAQGSADPIKLHAMATVAGSLLLTCVCAIAIVAIIAIFI